MIEEIFKYMSLIIYPVTLVIIVVLNNRNIEKMLGYFRERMDNMIRNYDNMLIKFMAISAEDKQKIFEIEKERVGNERLQIEITGKQVSNDSKRLDYLNQPITDADKAEEKLSELRRRSQEQLKNKVYSSQDL